MLRSLLLALLLFSTYAFPAAPATEPAPAQRAATLVAALADTFERQASTLHRKIQNLRRTRDLLLPRLLSGQVNLTTN